jgi:hypothetical protein
MLRLGAARQGSSTCWRNEDVFCPFQGSGYCVLGPRSPTRVLASQMPYAFISYAREDRPFVAKVTADLRAAGLDSWTDLDRIQPGADWEKAITDALSGAAVVLYVSSQHSGRSRWMEYELRTVLPREASVIPLILDEQGEHTLPDDLRRVQWIDFRQGYEGGLATLLRATSHLRTDRPLPSQEPKSKGYAFISYAEEDSAFVQRLIKHMSERGYAHWAYQFSRRKYQALLDDELEEAIQGASATLCVVSPNWKQSRKSKQELAFSEEVGVPVFLLRVADPGPTFALAGRTHIDFSRDELRGFAELDRELAQNGL